MKAMESKTDIELINIVDNCELDLDCRKHAAIEIYKRVGVNPWNVSQETTAS